jgi:hypothetical protein
VGPGEVSQTGSNRSRTSGGRVTVPGSCGGPAACIIVAIGGVAGEGWDRTVAGDDGMLDGGCGATAAGGAKEGPTADGRAGGVVARSGDGTRSGWAAAAASRSLHPRATQLAAGSTAG